MKKEYIAPRAAAIRLAMEDTMLTTRVRDKDCIKK